MNPTKIDVVKETFLSYEQYKDAEVLGVEVNVEEFGHPKGIEAISKGAMDRAKQAFNNCDFSVGIEGGLMPMPYSKTGFMEIAVCAIFDGKEFHLGTSPACEWPKKVMDKILNEGLDGSQAIKAAGLTSHPKIGTSTGLVHMLTDGKLNRQTYNKMAVYMAIGHILHPEYF